MSTKSQVRRRHAGDGPSSTHLWIDFYFQWCNPMSHEVNSSRRAFCTILELAIYNFVHLSRRKQFRKWRKSNRAHIHAHLPAHQLSSHFHLFDFDSIHLARLFQRNAMELYSHLSNDIASIRRTFGNDSRSMDKQLFCDVTRTIFRKVKSSRCFLYFLYFSMKTKSSRSHGRSSETPEAKTGSNQRRKQRT